MVIAQLNVTQKKIQTAGEVATNACKKIYVKTAFNKNQFPISHGSVFCVAFISISCADTNQAKDKLRDALHLVVVNPHLNKPKYPQHSYSYRFY